MGRSFHLKLCLSTLFMFLPEDKDFFLKACDAIHLKTISYGMEPQTDTLKKSF